MSEEIKVIGMSTDYDWKPLEYETFSLLAWEWDVAKAKRLVEGIPHEVGMQSLESLKSWIGKRKPDEEDVIMDDGRKAKRLSGFGMIAIDWDRVDEITEDQIGAVPLIVAPLGGDNGHTLIDGWHQAAKAIELGITELPSVVLTIEESRACITQRSMKLPGTPKDHKYSVQVRVSGYYTLEVEADDEYEADRVAREKIEEMLSEFPDEDNDNDEFRINKIVEVS
jgi:hypothetical protein